MPLSEPNARREIHNRVIDMKTYARDDGLYEVEAHLVDTKPFPFKRVAHPEPIPAGKALHDLWVRFSIDADYVIQHIEASSDVTPFSLCKGAESTLVSLIGEQVGPGWSRKVKERLKGSASCTHLMEMLIPMATTAFQGIRGLNPARLTSNDSEAKPPLLDSCYAFSSESEVVKVLWPEHYTGSTEE